MAVKRYFWLKLQDSFFSQKEIKKLRRIAGGDTYTIIYLKLQLISLKNGGKIYYEGLEDTFYDEMALDLDEDSENVKFTIIFLQKYGLVQEINENEFLMSNVEKSVGSETQEAVRVRRHREKQKALQSNGSVTNCNVETETETETEQETEIETETKQQHIEIEKILKNNFDNEEIETIRKYCIENNVVDVVVAEKIEIINHMKKIRNKVGALLTAIKENWKPSKSQSNYVAVPGFNNFEAREYDYDSLEKKLLGWDND